MDFLAAIRRDSERFYATADHADPSLVVPSCPEWTVADLVWHLGEVHWFWATIIDRRADSPEIAENAKPERPASYKDLVAWGRSQLEHLTSALADNDDAIAVWTWALDDTDHSVGFIRRHQVQEAAVHRWDIENAVSPGGAAPIEPDVASDSIDEILAITVPWSINEEKPLRGTVHLHCTDADGEWFVETNGAVERVHKKGDVALRGTASDLLLAGYKRVPIGTIDLIGDEALGREFLERIDGS